MKAILRTIPVAGKPSLSKPGRHSLSFVADVPPDLHSEQARFFRRTIPRFGDEAIYIYSLPEQRLLYAHGWESLLGYRDEEMTMLRILALTTPQFAPFVNALNEKALSFFQAGHSDIDQYSFTIELRQYHQDGRELPAIARIGVFEVVDGRVATIVGRVQLAPHLRFGKVLRYAAYGPEKNRFEEALSQAHFILPVISKKEREALAMVASGAAFKEIADRLGITQSAVEKRILPLYRRFGVKSLPHLVSYAYDNGILP